MLTYHRMMLFVALVVVFAVAVDARRPHVFAIWTKFGTTGQRTILVGGEISMTNGQMNQTSTLFEYLGSSETLDGISAYDQKTGNFFLAPGWPMPLVERVHTAAPAGLLAPIWLEDAAVVNLAFDWRARLLYVTDVVQGPPQQSRVRAFLHTRCCLFSQLLSACVVSSG